MCKATISVPTTTVGDGLKEKLHSEAERRGKRKGPFVEAIVDYAVQNRNDFKGPLKKPLKKGGLHISVKVNQDTKTAIIEWAEDEKSNQAMLTDYILQKAVYEIGLDKIF